MLTDKSHMELSTFIKHVHEELRKQSQLLGVDSAWKLHCSNESKLKKYASVMKELSRFWEKNFFANSKAVSRITWTVEECLNYFTERIHYFRQKESNIMNKLKVTLPEDINVDETNFLSSKLRLLDVGSCYNPFKIFEYFDITAIDIAPALEEVYTCDFLNVNIGDDNIMESNTILQLMKKSFDIVIFSLLLEYLPTPKQRLECCKRAYKLLKSEGLLVIITPDSKHVGANAKLMKSWRFVLANIGFSRIKYEKLPHIHCMIFRKSLSKSVTLNWVKLHETEQVYSELYIPQDFSKLLPLSKNNNHIKDPSEVVDLFLELPDIDEC